MAECDASLSLQRFASHITLSNVCGAAVQTCSGRRSWVAYKSFLERENVPWQCGWRSVRRSRRMYGGFGEYLQCLVAEDDIRELPFAVRDANRQ